MMNNNQSQHRVLRWILLVLAVAVIVYGVYFIRQVWVIRKQILSGEYAWQEYGRETSGAGGANIGSVKYAMATDDDPAFGADGGTAKVVIVEFGDFSCPFCRKAFPIIRRVVSNYQDKVRLIYRDFPLLDDHPQAKLQAQAGFCAHEQGKFWPMHDKMFQNQEQLSRDYLFVLASQVGLDETKFRQCLDSPRAAEEVMADWQDGALAGVSGTPTWFINGVRVAGVIPEEVLTRVIEEMIGK